MPWDCNIRVKRGMLHVLDTITAALLIANIISICSAFSYKHVSLHPKTDALYAANTNDAHNQYDGPTGVRMQTPVLTTASGKPICRYALGGAARSVQPSSLPLIYRDILSADEKLGSPFYFYYNPHRYPAFLSGVKSSFADDGSSKSDRKDVFIASGGSDRGIHDIDQRLKDALQYSGGTYLDAFVLEYICPEEIISTALLDTKSTLQDKVAQTQLGQELETAILHLRSLVAEGKIRHILASTHSHFAGAVLANSKVDSLPALDGIMLRYNLSHKKAAESLSLPYALKNDVPVIAFTTTRWNRLLKKDPINKDAASSTPPKTAECIKFALKHPAVEIVLHSARDEEELQNAIEPLLQSILDGNTSDLLSDEEYKSWREYGSDELVWNEEDDFDEYPDEIREQFAVIS